MKLEVNGKEFVILNKSAVKEGRKLFVTVNAKTKVGNAIAETAEKGRLGQIKSLALGYAPEPHDVKVGKDAITMNFWRYTVERETIFKVKGSDKVFGVLYKSFRELPEEIGEIKENAEVQAKLKEKDFEGAIQKIMEIFYAKEPEPPLWRFMYDTCEI